MELERPRKMELLYTPRADVARMMKENSISAEELIFLYASNKLTPAEIRMNSPSLNDKLLSLLLKYWVDTKRDNSEHNEGSRIISSGIGEHAADTYAQKTRSSHGIPQVIA